MCCYILTVEKWPIIVIFHLLNTYDALDHQVTFYLWYLPCLIVESDKSYNNYFHCTHKYKICFTQSQQFLNETMDVSLGLGSKFVLQIIPRCSINCDWWKTSLQCKTFLGKKNPSRTKASEILKICKYLKFHS